MNTLYDQLIMHIKSHVHICFDKDLIIDPHAKEPAFMKGIESLAKMVLFYNIRPTLARVNELDFLHLDFDKFNKTLLSGLWFDDVHIVSQPPPEQAEQFIEMACKFAESVSLVMPKKAQYAFPTNYQRLFSKDLPEKDMVFQIWLKADY